MSAAAPRSGASLAFKASNPGYRGVFSTAFRGGFGRLIQLNQGELTYEQDNETRY